VACAPRDEVGLGLLNIRWIYRFQTPKQQFASGMRNPCPRSFGRKGELSFRFVYAEDGLRTRQDNRISDFSLLY
jgi:hypothetical protein